MTTTPRLRDPPAEGDIRKSFCKLRNRLRKTDPYQLLSFILNRMGQQWQLPYIPTKDRDLPWLVFQIIKFGMRYGAPFADRGPSIPKIYQTAYNEIHDLWGRPEFVSGAPSLWMFLKNLSYQEFWLQEGPRPLRLARLGNIISLNAELVSAIETLSGVPFQTLLEMSLASLAATPKNQALAEEYFEVFADRWPRGALTSLLTRISLTPHELRRKFIEYDPLPLIEELYDRTPLREYPLVRQTYRPNAFELPKPLFISYYPTLTARVFESLPLTLAHKEDPYKTSQLFSRSFERYVGQLLAQHGDLLTESSLRRCNPSGKVVDFALLSACSTILVECKSGTLPHRAGTTQSTRILRNSLKEIIEKAILQGLSTANSMESKKESTFLLIVTLNDFDLGPVDLLVPDEWQKELQTRATSEGLDISQIPLTNVSLVSVEDLEFLLSKSEKASELADLLRRVAIDRSTPGSSKFSLSMYLKDSKPHPISREAAERFFGQLEGWNEAS